MTEVLDASWYARHPLTSSSEGGDKDARGTVLVIGGSTFVPGAPILTGEAALRVGAGKVQLGVVETVAPLVGVNFPEAAVAALAVDSKGEITSAALQGLHSLARSCDVLVVGPGMGKSACVDGSLEAFLDTLSPEASVLLDAGALAALNQLKRGFAERPNRCVITPHHGELATLLGCDRDAVAGAAERAARVTAERFNVIVTLKAETTFVAVPGGMTLRYVSQAEGLGTAGSGDVLAGVIAGLLAGGGDPVLAAAWGVKLHGEAAITPAGRAIGTKGYLARELLGFLPRLASAAG